MAIFSLFAFSMLGLQSTLIRAHDLAHTRIQVLTQAIHTLEIRGTARETTNQEDHNKQVFDTQETDQVISFDQIIRDLEQVIHKTVNLPKTTITSVIVHKKCLTTLCTIKLSSVMRERAA